MTIDAGPAPSRSNLGRRSTVIAVVGICTFVADQLSKAQIVATYAAGEGRDVIPGLLTWTFVKNVRGAYGLFGDHAWLLILMALIVLVIFGYSFRELIAQSNLARIAYGMIAGGAFGNIADRLHYGFVVDFIAVRPLPIFEVFNVADACVSVGVPLLIIASLAVKKP